jgi:protein tyrosine phosphatase (PTP) superfamily phosphohydrolase (DUF442 family)
MNLPNIRAGLSLGLLIFALSSCSSPEKNTTDPGKTEPSNTEHAVMTPKVEIKNLSTPFDQVMCSGQPSEAQFDALKAAGVTRVINLRMASENGTGWEEERAKQSGVEFVRLEIAGKDGLTRENVDSFAKLLEGAASGTTLVSCGSSNRVGAMFALKAFWIDKKTKEEALAIGTSAGMKSLKPAVEQLISK